MRPFPIPPRMQHLARDPRGYAIPYTVAVRHGRPHFTVNEEHLRQECLRDDLCPICGTKLWRMRWFVGGPLSAFDPAGAYLDPPMHTECAHYALQVCPYLAAPKYSGLVSDRTMPVEERPYILTDDNVTLDRPDVFVAVASVGQTLIKGAIFDGRESVPVVRYVKPKTPYRIIEQWRHGEMIGRERP